MSLNSLIKFLLALMAFLVISCSSLKRTEGVFTPDSFIFDYNIMQKKLEKLSAIASVHLNSKFFNGSIELEINATRNDTILIDAYTFLGINLATVLLTNDSILVYVSINDKLFRLNKNLFFDPAKTGFDIQYGDLFSLMTCYFDLTEASMMKYFSNDGYKIIFKKPLGDLILLYEFNFDKRDVQNIKLTLQKDPNPFEVIYSNFKKVDDFLFPHVIEIKNNIDGTSAMVKYKSVKLNPNNFSIDTEIFKELQPSKD